MSGIMLAVSTLVTKAAAPDPGGGGGPDPGRPTVSVGNNGYGVNNASGTIPGALQANASGGTPPYSYSWSSPGSNNGGHGESGGIAGSSGSYANVSYGFLNQSGYYVNIYGRCSVTDANGYSADATGTCTVSRN